MPDPLSPLNPADRRILAVLQSNARATLAELAEAAHLSVSQTQRRLKQLEAAGVIETYTARLNASALGLDVMVFVEVSLTNQDTGSAQRFHTAVDAIDEIVECHRVSGDSDYLLKVLAGSLQDYSRFAQTRIMAIPEVDRLRSLIVFESPKPAASLPLSA